MNYLVCYISAPMALPTVVYMGETFDECNSWILQHLDTDREYMIFRDVSPD